MFILPVCPIADQQGASKVVALTSWRCQSVNEL